MDTIKQKTALVKFEGAPHIEVRRMRWKATRQFLKLFGNAYTDFIKGAMEGGLEENQKLAILAQLPNLIAQSEVLSTYLVTNATDLTAEQLDALDGLLATEVLRVALEINLDDEIKNSFAGIGAAIVAMMPAKKAQQAMTS
jgi:hypothetical protein